MFDNLILATDSYKASHWVQYPPGTQHVYSYIESRGGKWDRGVFFGLQMFLKKYLTKPVTQADIEEAAEFFAAHGEPFNREGWEYIVRVHGGRLPLLIKAVPEGMVIDNKNVLVTVINTDPHCFWLTSYMETALLRAIWYPTTVATNSFHAKLAILRALSLSSDDPAGQVGFKLHDFGARGASSQETAAIGGAAHLVNFMGTDTVEGIMAVRRYYGEPMAGFSIPAAEHSTICSWGQEREVDAYRNMLRQFAKPGSIVACVSDSYDIHNAVKNIWGGALREEVLNSGATLVVRPDSGDPLTVPVEVVKALAEKFGCTMNSKGYKVLPSAVRVIQGDGINETTLPVILNNLLAAGFSADNLTFGMGGGLLQQLDRDTLKFAMKCSAISINGIVHDVFKAPKTDPGKRSKRGMFALVRNGDRYETVRAAGNEDRDILREVYRDGVVLVDETFADIRARAHEAALRLAA